MANQVSETISRFSKMTNAEAYVEVFHNRLMRPLPDSDVTGEYWGSTTRADFYPYLRATLSKLSMQSELRVLDVGAGSGEMVDHVLKDYPAVVSAVEPNPLMLGRYMEALKRHCLLQVGSQYQGQVQRLYSNEADGHWLEDLPPQNLVIAAHMIYGLTSSKSTEGIHPWEDLLNFMATMYEKLADDGVLFIVYAIGENTLLGEDAAHYLHKLNPDYERNVRMIWRARTRLLEHCGVKPVLDAIFTEHTCEFSMSKVHSCVYGDTVDDIAGYCTLGELTELDQSPFDIRKMQHNFDFIENHGEQFNLGQVLGGMRDGMVTVPTPQVICTLKKCRI